MKLTRNSAVANEFASGATEGRTENLFIEGDVIYSYGHHFPIAVRLEGSDGGTAFLFNKDGYSNTTARHKNLVLSAIRGEIIQSDTNTIKEALAKNIKSVRQFVLEFGMALD